ncbi:ABC transporter ATP-binding protein [Paenibacillus sp. 1P07SE]|uniref:ABC transporter ATP-binding protein n=1 Tax=Paenibacillus sp. 1P07SE TaxID=3132209 RepID=UPI0039A76820
MEPVLEVDRVTKSFRKGKQQLDVLGGIDVTVGEGEFVSLIGPSGSGKTTLFQLIGGLELPDRGTIRISGQDVAGQRGHIAYMPQQAALLPWRTVTDNIVLALSIAGVAADEARRQSADWLPKIGLEGYGDSYPHTLSGGMQQRVSFLRALLAPRDLMCLDEPFGALDALTRLQMQQWLLSIWETNRRSVLMVTHSIEEALLLSDRILVMSASPATVIRELPVPFARPRSSELWTDPRFNAWKQELYELLSSKENDHGTGERLADGRT